MVGLLAEAFSPAPLRLSLRTPCGCDPPPPLDKKLRNSEEVTSYICGRAERRQGLVREPACATQATVAGGRPRRSESGTARRPPHHGVGAMTVVKVFSCSRQADKLSELGCNERNRWTLAPWGFERHLQLDLSVYISNRKHPSRNQNAAEQIAQRLRYSCFLGKPPCSSAGTGPANIRAGPERSAD